MPQKIDFTTEHSEILTRIDQRTSSMVDTQKDHESRIRTNERKINWYAGVGATVLFVFEAFRTKLFGGIK